MASRGYNGTISHVIRDVTNSDDSYLIANCGDSFNIFTKNELIRELPRLLETAEETDEFVQWYNCHLL